MSKINLDELFEEILKVFRFDGSWRFLVGDIREI